MENKTEALLSSVADYYSARLAEFGEQPRGVDWNGEEGQVLRFDQLCKIIPADASFSINDLGCGYGALFGYLQAKKRCFTYAGSDISESMIEAARQRYASARNAVFSISSRPEAVADFTVASGIFNVRLDHPDEEWLPYIHNTLDIMDGASSGGFAFNCLTSYSDAEKMRGYLYYADPCKLFDFCKRRYSGHVALLHDYGLYEFTILVKRKP